MILKGCNFVQEAVKTEIELQMNFTEFQKSENDILRK